MRVKLRHKLRAGLLATALLLAPVGGYSGILAYTGNLHAVSDGVLYRSAQLSKQQFADAIHEYQLKSILNLRGAHPGESWYDDEIAASQQAGIEHYDYPMSAKRRLARDQIEPILEIVRNAPKPLLIHCRSGADRSGLVAALFRLAVEHASPEEADRQLSLRYGHFPYLTSKTGAMDESFWAFVERPAGPPPGLP
jgi:protein tyrosine/serine phosphatase